MNHIGRRLLVKSLLFLAPVLQCWLALEERLQSVPNSYNQKKTLFEANMHDLEVISVGSSHGNNGIDPGYFSRKGFNLANTAQSIDYDEALIAYYISRTPKLKMVIIPVSYFTLFRQLKDLDMDWRMYLYYYYYWGIPVPGAPALDMRKYSLLAAYTPGATTGIVKRGFRMPQTPVCSPLGFSARPPGSSKSVSEETAKRKVQGYDMCYGKEKMREGIASLEKLLQRLQGKSVIPVIVTTPVYHTFSSNANQRVLEEMEIITDSMCRKYNCKWFNYFTDSRFDINDFSDDDHLNYLGAARFSKILDSEVIRPMLSQAK